MIASVSRFEQIQYLRALLSSLALFLSSQTSPLSSILHRTFNYIIGKLLVHTLCIHQNTCSHRLQLATSLQDSQHYSVSSFAVLNTALPLITVHS